MAAIIKGLSFLDRYLAIWVLLAMIIGCIIGNYSKNIDEVFTQKTLAGVSVRESRTVVSDSQLSSLSLNLPSALLPAIVVGLLVMMWPTLCKVQYEKLTTMFMTRDLWVQIGVSLVLNWVIGPFVMLGVASATLPDLPEYRTGVIMVGLAR